MSQPSKATNTRRIRAVLLFKAKRLGAHRPQTPIREDFGQWAVFVSTVEGIRVVAWHVLASFPLT